MEMTPRLSVPAAGIRAGEVLLRAPRLEDVEGILPAFGDPELREAGNLPAFDRDQLVANLGELPKLAEAGRLLALAALDADSEEVDRRRNAPPPRRRAGHRRDRLLRPPHARGRGAATTIARALAEHAFSLGIERVAAYVNVGNTASERVLERAGFTREGVVRSMPKPDGRRVDKTLFSLLPGE